MIATVKHLNMGCEGVPIIKGINGTELVDLILKYYDHLSDKYKRMIPLKMVYIPVSLEE